MFELAWNCSRLPWKQVHRHAHSLPQVWVTCGRVKLPRPRRSISAKVVCYPNGEQLLAWAQWTDVQLSFIIDALDLGGVMRVSVPVYKYTLELLCK